jgi:hypothetical protein
MGKKLATHGINNSNHAVLDAGTRGRAIKEYGGCIVDNDAELRWLRYLSESKREKTLNVDLTF